MTRVGVISQARMGSTRLPGKVLLHAAGKPLLEHHVSRLTDCGLPVLVATTVQSEDDQIVRLCNRLGVATFRGSGDDVLDRFEAAAASLDLDVIVRVTSDCPLLDGKVIAGAVDFFLRQEDDRLCVSNTRQRSYPRGMDFEIFHRHALAEAHARAETPAEREHVTPYLYQSGDYRIVDIVRGIDSSHYRLTVDTIDDLELVRLLMTSHGADRMSADELIEVLDAHPHLAEMNSHVPQKPAR